MKKLLYIFLGLSLMFGCSDDESNQTETLNGIWNLKNVSGGLAGINIDYNQGDVKWSFNLENNTLIVENNIITTGPEDIYAGLESGTYNIEITQSGEIQTLFINNTERGVLILLNDNLKIDDGLTADGFITEFER
ncbi:MAG TPA: hypothetical protein EYQ45_03385 [Flavobacteriaceae bacterium]|nr:hypothetical protein [Flavobacteriaceae bacterium]